MERLTRRDNHGRAYFDNDGVLIRDANGTFHQKKDMTAHYIHDRFVALDKVIDRLAAYEDTGLEPEDIDALQKREHCLAELLVQVSCGCAVSYTRLTELAQAEKEGRLVVLPCKVGDTVYIIRDKKIIIATVEAIHQWISRKWKLSVHTDKRYTHWVGYEVSLDDFGKTVFLTREEAEAALKEREEADNETD